MKTLNDVINVVQHETQLPRYKISLKIGKSRNYLSEVLRSGVSHEKEQEIIALLLDLVDDETTMLRNQVKELRLHLNYNEEVIKEKEKDLATKNLFIDGLDMENKGFMDNIGHLNGEVNKLSNEIYSKDQTIESLEKAGHATGKQLNKEITKNRILTASIIGLVSIFSVYLWVK